MPAAQTVSQPSAIAAQAAATYFGGRSYAALLPDMNRVLRGAASTAFTAATVAVTAALGLVIRKFGSADEELKEATFSVPASDTTPNFKVVRYGANSRGVYSYQSKTNNPSERTRLIGANSSEFEISLRRENGRDYYSVKTKKGFTGAINVETAQGSFTIYTHGDGSGRDLVGTPEQQSADTAAAPALDNTPSPSDRRTSQTPGARSTEVARRPAGENGTPAATRPAPAAVNPIGDTLPMTSFSFGSTLARSRMPRREPEPSNTGESSRASFPRQTPSSLGMDIRTVDSPLSTLPPAAESPQITLAEPQTTEIQRQPATANLSMPEMLPAPERREEPRVGGPQFARTSRIERAEPQMDEPIERPQRTPSRPLEFTVDSIPTQPLPGPSDVPTLAALAPETVEVRIAPVGPISPLPLPNAPEPELQAPPMIAGFRRSPPREPEITPDTSPERPPRREREPQLSFSAPQIPLPESTEETPQLVVITPQPSPLTRRPAPTEISLPERESAPEINREQLAETPPPPRSERRDEPPAETQAAQLARRDTGTPRPSTTAQVPPPEKKEEPKPDPLATELADARRDLERKRREWETAQNQLLEKLGDTPKAREALKTLASQQAGFGTAPQKTWVDQLEDAVEWQSEQLIDNAGLDTFYNKGMHLLGRGEEERVEGSVTNLQRMHRDMQRFQQRIRTLQLQQEENERNRVQRLKPIQPVQMPQPAQKKK